MDNVRNNIYIWVAGTLSLVALFFLPLLGTSLEIGLAFPTTVAGWVLYTASNLSIAGLNMLIFHSFMQQGKFNISKDQAYLEARAILSVHSERETKPLSPRKFNAREYGTKGVSLMFGSILAAIGFGSAIIVFNYIKFITYALVILFGFCAGIFQMKKTENYYTNEYLEYAKYVANLRREQAEEKKEWEALEASTEETPSIRELEVRGTKGSSTSALREEVNNDL